ncbi:hypothetical protein SLA2020_381510 [Shorea laevis]
MNKQKNPLPGSYSSNNLPLPRLEQAPHTWSIQHQVMGIRWKVKVFLFLSLPFNQRKIIEFELVYYYIFTFDQDRPLAFTGKKRWEGALRNDPLAATDRKRIDLLNFLPNRIDSDSIGSHPSQSKHPFRHPNPLYSLAEHPFHPSFGGRNTSRKRGAIN